MAWQTAVMELQLQCSASAALPQDNCVGWSSCVHARIACCMVCCANTRALKFTQRDDGLSYGMNNSPCTRPQARFHQAGGASSLPIVMQIGQLQH